MSLLVDLLQHGTPIAKLQRLKALLALPPLVVPVVLDNIDRAFPDAADVLEVEARPQRFDGLLHSSGDTSSSAPLFGAALDRNPRVSDGLVLLLGHPREGPIHLVDAAILDSHLCSLSPFSRRLRLQALVLYVLQQGAVPESGLVLDVPLRVVVPASEDDVSRHPRRRRRGSCGVLLLLRLHLRALARLQGFDSFLDTLQVHLRLRDIVDLVLLLVVPPLCLRMGSLRLSVIFLAAAELVVLGLELDAMVLSALRSETACGVACRCCWSSSVFL